MTLLRLKRIAAAAACACVVTAATVAEAEIPGVLRLAGALHCEARLADKPKRPETTALACEFRRLGKGSVRVAYEGEMVGSDLYLVDPGPVRLLWNVMAPTHILRGDALAGTYDITTRHDFELARTNDNILYGGLNDSVALELAAPRVEGVGAATKLTLRVSP